MRFKEFGSIKYSRWWIVSSLSSLHKNREDLAHLLFPIMKHMVKLVVEIIYPISL